MDLVPLREGVKKTLLFTDISINDLTPTSVLQTFQKKYVFF